MIMKFRYWQRRPGQGLLEIGGLQGSFFRIKACKIAVATGFLREDAVALNFECKRMLHCPNAATVKPEHKTNFCMHGCRVGTCCCRLGTGTRNDRPSKAKPQMPISQRHMMDTVVLSHMIVVIVLL